MMLNAPGEGQRERERADPVTFSADADERAFLFLAAGGAQTMTPQAPASGLRCLQLFDNDGRG